MAGVPNGNFPPSNDSVGVGNTSSNGTSLPTTFNAQEQPQQQQQQQTPFKRPRSTSPIPQHGVGKHLRTADVNNTEAANPRQVATDSNSLAPLLLQDQTRNATLNALLRLTASHDLNYAMEGDALLKSLATVFYDTVGWQEAQDDVSTKDIHFSAKKAWHRHITSTQQKWADFCDAHLTKQSLNADDLQLLETVLVILRNLSFVSGNLRLMAYSNDVLQILVGCLYEQSSKLVGALEDQHNNATPLCFNALHVLINLSPYLDVTGQQLVVDKLFLKSHVEEKEADLPAPETMTRGGRGARQSTEAEKIYLPSPNTFGQAADGTWGFGSMWLAKKLDTKEDVVEDLPHDFLMELTRDHLVRAWALFPALAKVLTDTLAPRVVTMVALELLEELISQARSVSGVVSVQNDGDGEHGSDSDDDSRDSALEEDGDIPDLREILCYTPDAILQRLVDFLYIPRLSSDSLEYNDPVLNIVTRVNPLRLLAGYDSTVDTDVRDRSLDVLVPLCELDSPDMAKRLGTIKKKKDLGGVKKTKRVVNSRLFDAVVPILDAKSGRNEAPLLATQLMRELSRAKENKLGLMYIQERVISIASKDPRVAHLAFNHLYVKDESGK
jgi:hypothetical protein